MPREILPEEVRAAYKQCDREIVEIIRQSATRIEEYQSKLLPEKEKFWTNKDGAKVGFLTRPVDCAGIYVPGGTASYPSSVLMNGVPAKIAGVANLIMVTPPGKLRPELLVAADVAGVDRIFALGGVQAVAALAFGLGNIPKVDVLVGPGNAYVTEAKKQMFGRVGLDMLAGPSEILVAAGDPKSAAGDPNTAAGDPNTAIENLKNMDTEIIAADLIGQSEHGQDSCAVLVTFSVETAILVRQQVRTQLEKLSRRDIAKKSLEEYGTIILCNNMEEMADVINTIAPEHLEIMVEKKEELAKMVKNAGAIFMGWWTPEPIGDYWAGPSHVLPTNGTARFASPLSVETF